MKHSKENSIYYILFFNSTIYTLYIAIKPQYKLQYCHTIDDGTGIGLTGS